VSDSSCRQSTLEIDWPQAPNRDQRGQATILQEIGQFDLGDAQNMGFERAANQLAIESHSAKIRSAGFAAGEI
jgi:hypothetical protein